MKDEFYIGYLDRSPPGLSRRLRSFLGMGAVLVVLGVGLLAARQTPAEPGRFDFGQTPEWEGTLYETPLPRLEVTVEGVSRQYLLVGAGKFGLPAFAQGHDGQRVRFRGTLIEQGPARMLEMNDPGSFQVIGPGDAGGERNASLGSASLRGELVDTKCYFGVMRPATGKVHRGCAVRCLSGGVPPGLLVRDASGNGVVVLLVGAEGGPLQFNVQWAARTIRAEGELHLRDNLPILQVRQLQLLAD